jgi:hypothetical protein
MMQFRQIKGVKAMSNRWNNYQYCDEFLFLDAAFLWLEIEPNDEQRSDPPVSVKGLQDRKFVKSKRWEEFLLQEDNEEFIFKKVLEMRKDKIFSLCVPLSMFGPKEDRDYRSQEERWAIEKEKPCSDAERKEVFEASIYNVTREELLCFADSLGEKPMFLFPEATDKVSSGWNKGEGVSRPKYQELIKALCYAVKIDLKDKEATGKLLKLVDMSKAKLCDSTIRGILDEVESSRLNNSNRRTRKK